MDDFLGSWKMEKCTEKSGAKGTELPLRACFMMKGQAHDGAEKWAAERKKTTAVRDNDTREGAGV